MKKLTLILCMLLSVTAFSQTLKVGQHYQGGIIFYLNPEGVGGLIAPLTGYIPIARKDAQGLYANQCMWGAAPAGGLGTDIKIGSGKHNTELILAKKSAILPYITAAEYCQKYTVVDNDVTYNDWFLPSKDEMMELLKLAKLPINDPNYINFKWYKTGYFNARFWTSSECTKGDWFNSRTPIPDKILKYYVWIGQFGYMIPESKGQAVYVLPVRQF